MFRFLLAALLTISSACAGDRLLVCGGDEVFQIDPAADPPVKLWSWRAKDHPEIPEDLRNAFNTTDECKPIDGGKRLLVTSSGGGCALLELPSGKPIWWARVTNAHSIEALPGGKIAVASSVGATGNQVLVFDEKKPGEAIMVTPLASAHGLVWDDSRKCLWAIGFDELVAFGLHHIALVEKSRHRLPDKDGHDLRAVPDSPELVLSTHAGVWRFHRDHFKFRPDPDLEGGLKVKSVDLHPGSGRGVTLRASGKNWWTDTIEFFSPAAKLQLEGETLYKARWIIPAG